ncbi:MAG: helix-hairpin-helix domain-containing protein [Syntrophotaleaceae bacterium]
MKKLFTILLAGLMLAAPMTLQPAFAAAKAKAASVEKVNINTAPVEQLQELPGIGKVVAERIVVYRTENGSFSSPEDLLKVKGVGKGVLKKIHDRIVLE